MYKQERKAGVVQYVLCICAGVSLWILCDIIGLLLNNTLAADILFIVSVSVLVYCVYVHYCAVFVYETDGKTLTITRKIGKKDITEKIKLSKIDFLAFTKPKASQPMEIKNFGVSVLSRKRRCYLVYEKKMSYF